MLGLHSEEYSPITLVNAGSEKSGVPITGKSGLGGLDSSAAGVSRLHAYSPLDNCASSRLKRGWLSPPADCCGGAFVYSDRGSCPPPSDSAAADSRCDSSHCQGTLACWPVDKPHSAFNLRQYSILSKHVWLLGWYSMKLESRTRKHLHQYESVACQVHARELQQVFMRKARGSASSQ